jgi:uncharacterized membrane protein
MHDRNGINLMRVDRAAYIAAGVALFAWAARRPGLASGTGAAAGAMLLYQAYTGRNPMFGPLGIRVNQHPAEADARETIVIDEMVAVSAPPERVYDFWRHLPNLGQIAPRLRDVEVRDDRRSRWRVDTPAGVIEWDAEITQDIPGREIAWRTTRRRALTNFGTIRFTPAPGARGTIVRVHLEYVPPAGSLGTAVARLVRESPQQIVNETLRRLRQAIETGEIATTEGQPAGSRSKIGWRMGRRALTRSEQDRTPDGESGMVRVAVGEETHSRPGSLLPCPIRRSSTPATRSSDHLDRHLRLRPAPLRRLHPDDEEGRHPRPRVHGRGGRGRPRGQEPQGRRPRRGPVPDRLRRCFFCSASSGRCATTPTPTPGWPRRCGLLAGGIFGYSHMYGGYAGGQAEYVRVPFADVGPLKVPRRLPDEQVLFLSDIFPTGYMAAENCNIQPGDVVAVWGCGPVGQFAIKSAKLLGAERVIAIDRFPERLRWPRELRRRRDARLRRGRRRRALKEMTGGRGPDACIDAVGWRRTRRRQDAEIRLRPAKQAILARDRPAGRAAQAIMACRNGGTVSVPGRLRRLHRQVPDGGRDACPGRRTHGVYSQ